MARFHCTRAVVVAAAAVVLALSVQTSGARTAAQSGTAPATFQVFLRGALIGNEQVTVERTADGWTIASTGRLGVPLDVVARRLQVRYDADWKPLELTLDASVRGQESRLHTVVTGSAARSEVATAGSPIERTDAIDPAAVLLPNPFFAPYEALAVRLVNAAQGAEIPLFIPAQPTTHATVGESKPEQIQTPTKLVVARRTKIAVARKDAPLELEIWMEQSTGRLLRVSVPEQGLEVARDDIASVAARRVTVSRPNDEPVRIQGNGFSLAGTVSKPQTSSTGQRLPAVILVGGSGPTDRDETVAGIPIFGQLAADLADRGFLVLRYDKRGVGQSGGRPESATLIDFAEDARAVVRYVSGRKDVDDKRLAIVGHSEGGSVGMLTATKDNRVKALVLVAAI